MRNLFLLTDSHPATSCCVNMLSESFSNILFNLRFLSCSNECSYRESPCRNKIRKEWGLSRVLQGHGIKAIARCHLLERCGSGRSSGEGRSYLLQYSWASLVAQMGRNPPAMQETRVQSLGQEDPLEEGTATHSNILAWRIPRTEEPGGLQSMGSQRVRHD